VSAKDAAPRLLVVNNASFAEDAGRLLIAPPTGRFLMELAAAGFRVRVAQMTARYGAADTRSDFDLREHPEVEVAAIPWRLDLPRKLVAYVRAVPWIAREVRAADFVYLFLPGHLPLLFVAACRLLRRPYGVLLRGELDGPRLRFALERARFALTTSEALREAAGRAGTDAAIATPMLDLGPEDLLESRPPREPGPWRLLFVGRVEAAKGIPELLEAVGELGRRGHEVELDAVGWALEFERHRNAARERGQTNVRFHGAIASRKRLRELYDRADAFVLASRSEGFPRVLYEAMARGLPIVTTFVGGIPARMTDGQDCLRAPVRDAAGLANALERVLVDPALRARLTRGGRETARAALSGERPNHAAQVAERLRAVLGRSGTPRGVAPSAGKDSRTIS